MLFVSRWRKELKFFFSPRWSQDEKKFHSLWGQQLYGGNNMYSSRLMVYVGIFVSTGWVCYPVLGEDGWCFVVLCWFFPVNYKGEGEWLGVGCPATSFTVNWSVDHTRSTLRFTVIQVTKEWIQWILKQTLKQRCCHKRQEDYITSVFNFSIIGRRQALLP